MNDEEFAYTKLLKLKYRKVDQIIQTLCKISSPHKLGRHFLISKSFKTLKKGFLNNAEYIEM